jgi:hypothetical protein
VIRFRQKMNNWKRKVKIEKKLLLEHGDPSFPLSEGHRRSRSATTSLRAPNSFTALPSKKNPSQLIQEPKRLSLPTTPEVKRTCG